jgi:hypothetical protein
MTVSSDTLSPWARKVSIDATGVVRELAIPDTCSKSVCDDLVEDDTISASSSIIRSMLVAETNSERAQQQERFSSTLFSESASTDAGSSSVSMDSLEATLSPQRSLAAAHDSVAVLDFMDNLDDVDESYMLSVYFNSGDAVSQRSGNTSSVAGNTICSYASTNSSATSMSNYTWTSSSRRRHKGAYKNRSREAKKTTVVANWIDTMHLSTDTLMGPLNKWSISKGWQNEDVQKWDPIADINTWGCPDPIFDKKSSESWLRET